MNIRKTQSLLMLIVLLAVVSAAGCAATPEDRWFQQRETLNTANRVYLAHVPTMTDEQIVHCGELLQTARASLEEARVHLPQGGSAFDTTLDIVESILARVIALEAGDVPVPAAPTTPNTEEAPDDRR